MNAAGINSRCLHSCLLRCCVSKVVLPLALGQLARFTPMRKLHERQPKVISRLSECILLTVIYTTFCDTFSNAASEFAAWFALYGKMGRARVRFISHGSESIPSIRPVAVNSDSIMLDDTSWGFRPASRVLLCRTQPLHEEEEEEELAGGC